MDVKQAVNMAKKELYLFENPTLEAEWLVALSLGKKRAEVHGDYELTKGEERMLIKNIKKRAEGCPLEYVVGTANFYGYELKVNKNVLIPRPETEQLAEEVISEAKVAHKILDIGTGSGAIAIAVKKQTNAEVVAVDVSGKALRVAKHNAKLHNADIKFIKSNLFSKLAGQQFDIIVSNPPYVTNAEYAHLDRTVKDYEPKLALYGGGDGLDFYRKIILDAPKHLKNGGKIFFEIGYSQASEVKKLLKNHFKDIVIKKDLEGQDRMVIAAKGD